MTSTPALRGADRRISVGAFVAWLLLFGTTYAYLPLLQYAWGFNLLRYMPDWLAWLVTCLALLVTTEEARRGLVAAGRLLTDQVRRVPKPVRPLLAFALALACLWLLRDRVIPPDAAQIGHLLRQPGRGTPAMGGAWLMAMAFDLGRALGIGHPAGIQLVSCVAGAGAIVAVTRAARLATPTGTGAWTIPCLAFSGGLGAVLTGRLDVQSSLLLGLAVYLWLGLRHLRSPGSIAAPAGALGVLILLEPYTLSLLPSLGLLARGRRWKDTAAAIALLLTPLGLSLASQIVAAPDWASGLERVPRALGTLRGFVGLPGRATGVGTDYVILSVAHLKYLTNAGMILAGGSAVLGLALAANPDPHVERTPQFTFLAAVTIGLGLAAIVVRPIMGPWSWELFALAGLALAFLVGASLARLSPSVRNHSVAAAVGLQLCFFGLPLVGLGFGAQVNAGPFHPRRYEPQLPLPEREPSPRIAPWL